MTCKHSYGALVALGPRIQCNISHIPLCTYEMFHKIWRAPQMSFCVVSHYLDWKQHSSFIIPGQILQFKLYDGPTSCMWNHWIHTTNKSDMESPSTNLQHHQYALQQPQYGNVHIFHGHSIKCNNYACIYIYMIHYMIMRFRFQAMYLIFKIQLFCLILGYYKDNLLFWL